MHKRLMAMKENLASCIEYQLTHIDEVDSEELGEAIDMLKDLEEALYFCTITEAMNSKDTYNFEHKKNGHSQMMGNAQMMYQSYYGGNGNSSSGNGGSNSGGNQSYYGGNGGGHSYYGDDGMSDSSYYGGGSNQSYYQGRDSQGRFTSGRGGSSRSSYTEPMYERDEREGRSPQNRRMYMEAKSTKDKATQLRELEKYMQELTSDMVEMIQDSSPEEKQYLEKKISALATKIGQMK